MSGLLHRPDAASPGAASGAAAGDAVSHRRTRSGWLPAMLRRLHFFAGVLIGPFILIAAVSGALYAIAPQIERVLYVHELTAGSTLAPLPLADQIEAAEAYAGVGSPVAVRPAPDAGDTTRVLFADPALGESQTRAVFVDPGTAEIRGDLTAYGTSGSLPVRTWISDLHRSLHLGDVGRWYSELAASWLGIVASAGLALWILRFRKSRRARRDMVRPNRAHRGYRRAFGWHASLGIWVVLGALFLAATGITWSTFAGANVSHLRTAVGEGTPALTTTLDGAASEGGEHAHHGGVVSAPTGAANPATFDAVLAIAQRINVNTGQVEIRPPSEPGTAWVVQEIQRSFPTEVDAVAIDGSTMQVTDRVDFADFPVLAKLSRWGVDLHMGTMFGLVNQLVLFALALAIAAMVVLGYVMWWKRRPTRGFGAAPSRGALRSAPWWGITAVFGVAVVIGLFLPLVGYTLAAFVVLDAVLGWRTARATAASADASSPSRTSAR